MNGPIASLNAEKWKPLDETLSDGRWVMVAICGPDVAAPWFQYKAFRQPEPIAEGHTGWWHETGGLWVIPTLYREIEDSARSTVSEVEPL